MANNNNAGGNFGDDGDSGDFHADKTVMMGAEARAALARAMLHVESGPDQGFSYPVAGATTTVGRGSSCDIVLNDQHVSRLHFRLEVRGGAYTLVDAGSGNGTLVDGQKKAETVLQDGAEIQLGGTVLRFALKGPGAVAAQSPQKSTPAAKAQSPQPVATTKQTPPPKGAAAAAPKKGGGAGKFVALMVVLLLVGAAVAAAGDLYFGWWSIPKLRTMVPASWVKAPGASSSTTASSGGGSACDEYIKKTCELAGGNEMACSAAKSAAANMSADQCKLAVSAMAGVAAPGGALDSAECQEYIKKTCELAGGNETACAGAKTAAANMTAEQCKLAVSAMAGAAAPGGAADSAECQEYIKKTCELAGGNETACAGAKTAAAAMTADQCKLAVTAMAGAAAPGGAADSAECQEYIKKTCELAGGNETACAGAKTAAAAMTVDQCKLAVTAMAGAVVPAGGAADSAECQEYIKKTCELAGGNETACAAAKTAAANMTADQCKLAVTAMAGAVVPAGGAADSAECQEYIKKTCELAGGNETACAAAKTAAANMTADQCKLAVTAMAGAVVPTGGAAESAECQEYIKKTCELAGGNETACAAAKTAAANMTADQCKLAVTAMAGAVVPKPAGNPAPECEEYVRKMCERAKGNEIACTAARTATSRMTPDQCKLAASTL